MGYSRGLENYQIINIEGKLKPTKPKTRFVSKKPSKGTYKSQNLIKDFLISIFDH